MEIFYSIVFGAVQALSEFLPISSSGHLVLLHDILGFSTGDDVLFDVALHLGTLCAIVLYFWRDVCKLFVAWLRSIQKRHIDAEARMAWYILYGTIPAAIAGFLFEDYIDAHFRSPVIVMVMLVIIGILFFVVDTKTRKITKTLSTMKLKNSLLIGFAQVLALIPGTSRSGITILMGMKQGFSRYEAARFSFLLSIPIVFAAGLKKAYDGVIIGIPNNQLLELFLGFIVSFLLGWLTIKYFLIFVQKYSLRSFAWYRFFIALLILLSMIFL